MAISDRVNFQKAIARLDVPNTILEVYRECQPKLLIVTDSLSFLPNRDFGLTQFASTLAASTIHGMTPLVKKAAHAGVLPGADIQNFRFDSPTEGLTKARYDVVFILGFDPESGSAPGVGGQLPQSEIDAIARFMQAGGGVFATGDHESLGAALSRDIPRVRSMRFWRQSETPNVASERRLSTNVSGPNEVEDFDDQSDSRPQTLYPNFRTLAGNPAAIGSPTLFGKPAAAHPLLQLPPTRTVTQPVLEVFPDHPHEGECRLPASLATTFTLDDAEAAEWPAATAGGALPPEVVAMTMSHGSGFVISQTEPKVALTPRAFIAICAYDGQRADVGRVVTDATWHHFVNVNLDGAASDPPALVGTLALDRMRQYYVNLATWLMPRKVRRCLRSPFIFTEVARFPLFEELVVPRPNPPDPSDLVLIGEQVAAALGRRVPLFQVDAILEDTLAEALGDAAAERLLRGKPIGRGLDARTLALGALGAVTASSLITLADIADPREIDPHKTFDGPNKKAATKAVRALLLKERKELQQLDGLFAELEAVNVAL